MISSGVQIHPPAENYKFPAGATYVYSVDWRVFTAGTATLRMDSANGEQRVVGTADSAGVVSLLYKVRDRFESFVSPKTFCSLTLQKHTEEGFHRRDTTLRFDYARHKSVLDEKNLKTNDSKHIENDIPDCVTDVLSATYYLSSLPLTVGANYSFPLNDGGKTVTVTAKVEGREQVKVTAGVYPTVRVKPEAPAGIVRDRGEIMIWFSDDSAHIPVQMRARLSWGTLTFKLLRIDKSGS